MDFILKKADLYLSSSCNLHCDYCYISKNPGFYELDVEVQKCIDNNIFLKKLKDVFVERENLEALGLWGAEPSLGYKSFSNTVYTILDEFPNLKEFSASTNFTTPISNFTTLLDKLDDYGREIVFKLQVSLDGPPSINDSNRGDNVFDKISNNLDKLYEYYSERELKNLKIFIHFKPTLSIDNLKTMIQGKNMMEDQQRLYEYFKFFEDLHDAYMFKGVKAKLTMMQTVKPTLVVPGQHTVDDGKYMAKAMLVFDLLEQTIEKAGILKYHKQVNFVKKPIMKNKISFEEGHGLGYCGIFSTTISVLPMEETKITGCHRAFSDYFETYANDLIENDDLRERNVILSNSELRKALKENFFFDTETQMDFMKEKLEIIYKSHALPIMSLAGLIYEASLAGQADEIYSKDRLKLIEAAFIIRADGPCLYDNLATTGSYYLKDMSKIKLFCNGLLEHCLKGK